MVTPASIENIAFILLIYLYNWIYCYKLNILDVNYNDTINNKLKEDLLKNLNLKNTSKDFKDDKNFQKILNGLFQAEGNIYYEFYDKHLFRGRFKWSLSLNSNKDSILLFNNLNSIFNYQLDYELFITETGIHHIRIFTRDSNLILNQILPYFNNLYGDKFRGNKFFVKIKYILDILEKLSYDKENYNSINNKKYIDLIIKIIYLSYNLVDNSQRKLDLNLKIKEVLLNINNNIYDDFYLNNENYYKDYIKKIKSDSSLNNKFNVNDLWLLGFFLGDGNILMYLRDTKNNSIWFIHIFRITQKITESNKILLNLIKEYLLKDNIVINIKENKETNNIELIIENSLDLYNLINKWLDYKEYWFIKSIDILYCYRILMLAKLSKHWKLGLLLRLLFLKRYKYKKYLRKISNNKLILLSIDEILFDLNRILELNKDMNLFIKEKKINIVKEDLISLLKKGSNNKYYYPIFYNNTSKLLIFTNFYELIINVKLVDIDDMVYINKYKELGYQVRLPINIKPKTKYFYISRYGSKIEALLNSKIYKYKKLLEWLKKII